MKNISYHTIDKSTWGAGPWQDEPDKVQFTDPDTGLPCLIVRNHSGALCGYVGVSRKHPLFKKNYNDFDAQVHGGLTFSDVCQDTPEECHGVCHTVKNGEDDLAWWFGFDCAHYGDYCPAMPYLKAGQYRAIPYVQEEIKELARQLHAINFHTI